MYRFLITILLFLFLVTSSFGNTKELLHEGDFETLEWWVFDPAGIVQSDIWYHSYDYGVIIRGFTAFSHGSWTEVPGYIQQSFGAPDTKAVGDTYTLTFWAKTNDFETIYVTIFDGAASMVYELFNDTNQDWYQKTIVFQLSNPKSISTVQFSSPDMMNGWVVDDSSIKKNVDTTLYQSTINKGIFY